MIIAVDFDGVIYDGCYEIKGAFETLLYIKSKGHKLILWTCKSEQRLSEIVKWCASYGVIFDSVNACVPDSEWFCHPKVYADIYIDDKSFPKFTDWASFKKYIDNYETK